MLKRLTTLLLTCSLLIGYSSCSYARSAVRPKASERQHEIVLLFDNDVHGHVEGYPKMAALRGSILMDETPYVTLISLGDFSQGGIFCAATRGIGITTLMNKAGYDLVTLGNHEFDYGIAQLDSIASSLNAEVICCNFEDLVNHRTYFPGSTIRTYGDTRIGFIGMVAPLTETSDSPKSYYDADGNKIYTFHSGDFTATVQHEVDKLRREGVDYVVALSHLGDNPFVADNSKTLINSTHGIDVLLDAHSHTFLPNSRIANQRGDSVLVLSTGAHFQNMGKLTITTDGRLIPEMIPTDDYYKEDASIALTIDSLRNQFDNTAPLAHSDFQLYGFDVDVTYDRNAQTNLGSLTADALRVTTGADIGWINAGGIRQSIPAGDIRIKDLLASFPFFNSICVAECSGQLILDALEYGVNRCPHDFGSFPQVSGIRYRLDISIPSPVIMDVQERLLGFTDGLRRVSEVMILDPVTEEYSPIDPEATYTLASIDYLLKHHGSGDVFAPARIIHDDGFNDVQLLEQFLVLELFGHVDDSYNYTKLDY